MMMMKRGLGRVLLMRGRGLGRGEMMKRGLGRLLLMRGRGRPLLMREHDWHGTPPLPNLHMEFSMHDPATVSDATPCNAVKGFDPMLPKWPCRMPATHACACSGASSMLSTRHQICVGLHCSRHRMQLGLRTSGGQGLAL